MGLGIFNLEKKVDIYIYEKMKEEKMKKNKKSFCVLKNK